MACGAQHARTDRARALERVSRWCLSSCVRVGSSFVRNVIFWTKTTSGSRVVTTSCLGLCSILVTTALHNMNGTCVVGGDQRPPTEPPSQPG